MEHKIREIRIKAGLTQAQLATKVNVVTQTVGNWERGETEPNVAQVWDCAEALGCTPNDILGWKKETLSPDELRLIEMFRLSDPRGRDNLLHMADHEARREKE